MFNEFVDVAKIMQELKLSTSKETFSSSTGVSTSDVCDEANTNNSNGDNSFFIKELSWRQDELVKYREIIEEHKSVGTRIPKLLKFNRISRGILKCTAKFVNKASMVITKDQNIVNHNLLISIDRLRESNALLQQEFEQSNSIMLQNMVEASERNKQEINTTREQCKQEINATREQYNQAIVELSSELDSDIQKVESNFSQKVSESIDEVSNELLIRNKELRIELDSKIQINQQANNQEIENLKSQINNLKKEVDSSSQLIQNQSKMLMDLEERSKQYERQIELERIETRRLMQRMRNKFAEVERKYQIVGVNNAPTNVVQQEVSTVEKESSSNQVFSASERDLYYKEFEAKYRGSEEEIKNRLKVYISYLNNFRIYRCLDIGCGRGEWLELLSDNGYDVMGVDLNQDFVDRCNNKGLNVKKQDALSFLKECEDNSFDMISGFHIIEHIEVDELNQIIEECNRVLTPNGLIIFETPNPKNISVGSCNFYLDSTHIRPVHPERIKFQLEYFGFYNIEYIYWQQQNLEYVQNVVGLLETTELHPAIKDTLEKVVQALSCPEDYGIVGRKA